MYQDGLLKLEFYKERVIKELIKKGFYPDDKTVSERLSHIDASLALLNHKLVQEGGDFNAELYNHEISLLYKDLEFLYKLLYQITINEYHTLQAFVDAHLDKLEDMAMTYKLKAKQEENSTTLGNTVLFKHSGFNLYTQNNVNVVDLGDLSLHRGSRIACIVNANNIEADKILFGIAKEGSDPIFVNAYNYNQDSLIVPGQPNLLTYNANITEGQLNSGPIELNIGKQASVDNRYVIMAGKDKMLIKTIEENGQYLIERPTKINMASFNKRSYIDFYVVGGNTITFRFNTKPINANFPTKDYKISNLKHIHHFFIECDAGFAFDFELSGGEVYAVKESGIVDSNKLYFSRSINLTDFYIEEYTGGDAENYRAVLKIFHDDGEPIQLESVMVKELLMLGE